MSDTPENATVEPVVEPRQVLVDDTSYIVDELPEGIQQAINTYDIWVKDQAEAQKAAAQMASAVQFLAGQITTAIQEHVNAEAAEEGEATAGDDAPEAEAALDIPSDGE